MTSMLGKKSNNQLFIDVSESLQVKIQMNGKIGESVLTGKVSVRGTGALSSIPDVWGDFCYNDALSQTQQDQVCDKPIKFVRLDDITLNQTLVDLKCFAQKQRRLVFSMPGTAMFELMRYRQNQPKNIPLRLQSGCFRDQDQGIYHINVTIQSMWPETIRDIVVVIPLPKKLTTKPIYQSSPGAKVKYVPVKDGKKKRKKKNKVFKKFQFVWKIKALKPEKKVEFVAQVGPLAANKLWLKRKPVKLSCAKLQQTTSGFWIRKANMYVSTTDSNPPLVVPCVRWVRYSTKIASITHPF
eukprot:CAMPEP_0201557256 /NCGR_PEP_ID=MMETSP0173_2-20130828/60643_1 /ASSEMBLY_ACC=CAM_ASM_000268 /TAXON_ID=218659 /ORGANISM="Vexillifera sp., Strain DIVA3 564/2" /LENGTH=296 /DNA_ID=CAMNT_0047970013 /DNA_START=321 /DNA_END=1211 /DNA_ORIENTATION=-